MDDLFGWEPGELEILARWRLVRAFDLDPRPEADWEVEVSRHGVQCAGHDLVDVRQMQEAQRLLMRAYPGKRLHVRRKTLTEYPN